jgi:phosphoketolase
MYAFSPEAENELQLVVGQVYTVLKGESSAGWTFGQDVGGRRGLFPSSYVQKV